MNVTKEDFAKFYDEATRFAEFHLAESGAVPATLLILVQGQEGEQKSVVMMSVGEFMRGNDSKTALNALMRDLLSDSPPQPIIDSIGVPDLLCLVTESWMVLRNLDDAKIKGAVSQQDDRIECVAFMLSSKDYETMAYCPMVRVGETVSMTRTPLPLEPDTFVGGNMAIHPGRTFH